VKKQCKIHTIKILNIFICDKSNYFSAKKYLSSWEYLIDKFVFHKKMIDSVLF